jgi:hypothetical protein
MLTMSYDTIMGRARFSVEHRNIGRDPVLMQVQVRPFHPPAVARRGAQ